MTDALVLSPSQTVGPYVSLGLLRELVTNEVVPRSTPGSIVIRGQLLDGRGELVPDGLIETWQANPEGRYDDAGFIGQGRCGTADAGWFEIVTQRPGSVPLPNGRPQAPHIAVSVFARGLLKRLATRIYLPDETEANATDPVLTLLDAAQRATLVAVEEEDALRFDIRLQGPGQTTFFAV